jgi:apolipoprotein N-acyltransferase
MHSQQPRAAEAPDDTAPYSQSTPRPAVPFRFGLPLAILSGLLLWLAHPMPGLWPLAWVAVAPLMVSIHRSRSPRQAAVLGYVFGWAYLAPTWHWVGLTIVAWTGSPIGWVALVVLTLPTALFYALWAVGAWYISRRASGARRIVGLAASWVVMEWLRGVGALSLPWAQVCYTQYKVPPVIQIAEVTGALGVSFLIILVNASLVEWWRHRKVARSRRWVFGSLALVALACLLGAARMAMLRDGRPIDVAVMQGNFDYKNSVDLLNEKLLTFDALTRAAYRASNPKAEIYVWGETAAPGDAYNDAASRDALQSLADRTGASVFTGSRTVEGEREWNSALLFTPFTGRPQRFDKEGIVPFGEYIPFRAQIPAGIQKQFQFFDTDITPGRTLAPMILRTSGGGRIPIGPFICYESVYPYYTRTMTALGAQLLVTPSHDQWFQSEAAMEQHLGIVVFRAVENRRDVARATTDGISAFIDGRGRIVARAPMHTACFLVHRLHFRSFITLYTRFGDWFVLVCALLAAVACTYPLGLKWLERARARLHPSRAEADPPEAAV